MNHKTFWTEERHAELYRLWTITDPRPLTRNEVADLMQTTPAAIKLQLPRLGLASRPRGVTTHNATPAGRETFRVAAASRAERCRDPYPPGSPETWGLISGGQPWPGDAR